MILRQLLPAAALAAALPVAVAVAQTVSRQAIEERFAGPLDKPWSWLREKPGAWRTGTDGLNLRVLPGTLWGKDNSAENLLLRPAPNAPEFWTEVTVTTAPALMNEQAGLIWYVSDGEYVKLVKEMKDQPNIILAREQNEAAKTMGRIPMPSGTVVLRLTHSPGAITAHARSADSTWQYVGTCAAVQKEGLRVGVFANVAPGETDRWANFRSFRVGLEPAELPHPVKP